MKQSRADIHTAIAFLTTRVKQPDTDDWKKLIRLMKYLQQTINLIPTLSADDMALLKWHVDASHTVHPDCKGHTGGTLTIGKGTIYNTSTKQKLNTKSSTETELVGADDIMPQLLWTNYFLDAQGYTTQDTIMFQDNQSTMLLEKNGKASSSKRTKHINIRYFFIKDRYDKKELTIQYCPTDDMVADFFTKPLQGRKFKKFRQIIMNLKNTLTNKKEGIGTATNTSIGHRSVLDMKPKKH